MQWQVVFYNDETGNEPVKDFISNQTKGTIAEILHKFDLLIQFNVMLGLPHVRKVNKSGIRELRIKHGSDIYRFFFFAHTGQEFILLHAIKKKKDKLSKNDINLAIKRMDNYIKTH